MKLEEKYNNVLALNIELGEIIEMQSIELMKKDREIKELEKENLELSNQVNFWSKELDRTNIFMTRS